MYILVRQVFKGDNYSREETINYYDFLSATTIQGRQLFKGGKYSRKYGINFHKLFIFQDCGGKYSGANDVHQYQGVIQLPNLKQNYESDCSWIIELPDGYDIALNFTSFDLNDEALEIR